MPRATKRDRISGQGRGVDDAKEAERLRAVKRERSSGKGRGVDDEADEAERLRALKRERSSGKGRGVDDEAEEVKLLRAVKREWRLNNAEQVENEPPPSSAKTTEQDAGQRRALRSGYNEILNLISEKRNDLLRPESEKFGVIIDRVEKLHEQVQKPREQVADAEALLDITNTLVTSVKSQSTAGVTPLDFLTCVIRDFGQLRDGNALIKWKDIGIAVAPIFRMAHGCCTMLGPMNTEYKERKVAVRTRRTKPTTTDEPEKIDAQQEEKTDTDRNMSTMFEILRKNRCVRLECLILNRLFFAQTVENLFALSFLVKDGRAEIIVDANCCHFVAPRNAAKATDVASHEVVYRHFVFRFDFKDWKLMKDMVPAGEELMPHRLPTNSESASQVPSSQEEPAACGSQSGHTTPIWKLSTNRSRIMQEEAIVEESPEYDHASACTVLRKSKRKL